jgi:hypothetical protein
MIQRGMARRHGLLGMASLCVLLGNAPSVYAAMPGGSEPPPVLTTRVAELASHDFGVRQRATAELYRAGVEAIPLLAAAAASGDSEVRGRSLGILLAHALSRRAERRQPAEDALERLATSADSRVSAIARGTLEQAYDVTSLAAAAELNRLGANVMPVGTFRPRTFNVQIPQSWSGGDNRLALLADLGSVPWLSLENAPIGDRALPHIGRLTDITKLYLGHSGVTGRSLEALAPLVKLEYLSLKQLPIGDAALARLPDFPQLQYLGLDGTHVGNEGLKQLPRYPRLETLWLDDTEVTDAGLVHLRSLEALRTLYLPGTRAVGPGLADLRRLASLTIVSLKGARLAPDTLKHLARIEQLESIGLDQTNVTDDQLADLAGMKRLRILWLSGTPITDAGLVHLRPLTTLQAVHLSNTEVSSEAAAELQRSLPNCEVTLVGRYQQATLPNRPLPARPAPRVAPQKRAP